MGTPNSCLTHYLINSSFSYLLHFKLPTEKVYHSVPPAAGNFKKNHSKYNVCGHYLIHLHHHRKWYNIMKISTELSSRFYRFY